MDSVLNMIQIIHPQFAFKWVLKELKGAFASLDYENFNGILKNVYWK